MVGEDHHCFYIVVEGYHLPLSLLAFHGRHDVLLWFLAINRRHNKL